MHIGCTVVHRVRLSGATDTAVASPNRAPSEVLGLSIAGASSM